ncbi:MAG: GAF domain-containing protein [Methylacidiphilales bacterium]|nr:GAF domain-containing protein [Candidatus Methylacidiphilales bacterium]NJR19653.1 GAF domain-containing protein [Calothrix sp. CSU_2_0]
MDVVELQVLSEKQITNQIIRAIRSSLDLETIFNIAVNEVGKFLQVDHVKISEFISEEKGWLTVAEYLSHPGLAKSIGTYIPDKGNEGTAKLKRLEIFRIDDTNNCDSEVTRQIAQTFPGAWLILPLHVNSVVWGSLCLLVDGRPRYWQPEEVELITIIADQLAIAIQQSKLFQQTLSQAQQIQQLAEQEVCKALQRERELSEAKSNFIATTSHEIRTPLATIQSSLDLLQYYNDKLADEKKKSHFRKIETAVQRIKQIVQDTLLLSESEAGTLQFELKRIDAVKLCKEIIEVFIDRHRIEFSTNGDITPVKLDSKLVSYILNNLLENALKYSSPNTTVKFNLNFTPEAVIFMIQDQGIGIPKEDLSNIFDSFYRADNVGLSSGTGLGLAIVKQCVDLHRGKITVHSVINQGTTFSVTIFQTN